MKLKWRTVLISFLLLIVIGGSFGSVTLANKDDLINHYAEKEMREIIKKGILKGYGANIYKPDQNVTRAEFATFLYRALDLQVTGTINFTDVKESHMHYDSIRAAQSAGIITGYQDNTFKPEVNITRQEMAVMVDRALTYKKIDRVSATLTFIDTERIYSDYRAAVANNVAYRIIMGDQHNLFNPLDHATRAHASLFIYRMLDIVEPQQKLTYKTATISTNGEVTYRSRSFDTFTQALTNLSNDTIIYYGDEVVYMDEGLVISTPRPGGDNITIIRQSKAGAQATYVPLGAELTYVSSDENWVEVRYAGGKGYVHQEDARLIPKKLLTGQSYYTKSGQSLIHHIYNHQNQTSSAYSLGYAPIFMSEGVRYYSHDGITFYNSNGTEIGKAYQYFNSLSLRSKTNYTADDLERYIRSIGNVTVEGRVRNVSQESPLLELGEYFIEAQDKYQINALALFALAINESGYGLSRIATDHKNLFGFGASDRDPHGNAVPFKSYRDSILSVASKINENYLNPQGMFYNGAVFGNKGHGMNVRYASDPYWGQKIVGHIHRADRYLGAKDFNAYRLAQNTIALNARPLPATTHESQYRYRTEGFYLTLLEEVKGQNNETWHKVYSDHKDHEHAFVHGDYVRPISIAKP